MPTTCALTQGYSRKNCKFPAGTQEVLVAELASVSSITITAGVVSAITMASGKKFYAYKQPAGVAGWKQNWKADAKTGTGAYDLEVNIQTFGIDQAAQAELDNLVKNTLVAIVHDNQLDNPYWIVGKDNGIDCVTDGLDSGIAMTDFRGDKIQFTGLSATRALPVDPTIIAALTA